MASIPIPARTAETLPVRPLNILRDLPAVADLIEMCFSSTLDDEGQSYIQQMRRASRDDRFLRWAGQVVDSASLPMTGFVWEENGRIVGNASLVYNRYKHKKLALIANVATHPDFRRRGIGRTLTERAMSHARQKNIDEIWLHVRDDNATAIKIYSDLGFTQHAHRTTYIAKPDSLLPPTSNGLTVTRPQPRDWPLQRAWLEQAHPDELGWYNRWDWNQLAPGLWNWLYRFFIEFDIRQWAVHKENGELLATLSWMSTVRASDALWAAAKPGDGSAGLRYALEAARRELGHHRKLTLEYPADEMVEAIQSAGFSALRTLVWMRATA
ncbi:MAG: GNAT family N-acetyltransferase [Chloroflexi bacterium]|nr:GNAT family N-acetyltransferase [Chloroflexota bacterium]